MIYQRTEETIDPSPNGRTTTWINSLMSDSHYSVMDNPSQRVAVIIRRHELIKDDFIHLKLMPLWPDVPRFFNVVGRIACAIAETRPKDFNAVNAELNFTIRTMVNYATEGLHKPSVSAPVQSICLQQNNRKHVVDCARNLASFMPGGLWSDFHFQSETPASVIFIGVRHEVDYR